MLAISGYQSSFAVLPSIVVVLNQRLLLDACDVHCTLAHK